MDSNSYCIKEKVFETANLTKAKASITYGILCKSRTQAAYETKRFGHRLQSKFPITIFLTAYRVPSQAPTYLTGAFLEDQQGIQ